MHSIVGSDFAQHFDDIIQLRNAKILEERKLLIEMDAEVYRAFKASTAVSSTSLDPPLPSN